MDVIMIDITDIPSASVGEEVVLLGQQGDCKIIVNDLAQWGNYIPHEVVTLLGTRLPRHYIS